MAFRNNQRFPAANQNNNMQQQIPGNIRFPGNGNNIQGALAQQQIMQNALQAMQGAVTMNQPWGSGIPNPAIANIANQQQNLALATITSMANQANPAVNMMGLLANQQLLAQAALVGNRGMGMQVPFTGAGAGILGAGPPITGQLPQQMFPGASRNSYSPASTSSQHSNHSIKNARNPRSASRDRGMPQNARNNSRDRSQSRDNSNKSGDQNRDRNRRNEKGDDRGKFRKDDTDGKRDRKQPDDRLKDSRKGDRGDDRRKDRSRDDKDDRRGPKRDERSSDGRRKDSRDRPRGSGDDRRSDRGDKRDRDRGERSRDSDRRRDRDSSPERKRRRGRDEDPLDTSEILQYQEEEIPAWTRCSPSNLYFKWDSKMNKDPVLLYASVGGRELNEGLEYDEFHLIPGATYAMLATEAVQRATEIKGHKTIYFLGGIPDMLTTYASADGYEETIFEDKKETLETISAQMLQTEKVLKDLNCHVVFCTVSSISIRVYNQTNLKEGRTNNLKFESLYGEMQEGLHRLIKEVNNVICGINHGQRLLTPLIHSHINKRSSRKDKTIFRLNKLPDGLNPCEIIIDGWKTTLNKTMYRNRIEMDKPEFGLSS